MLTEVVQCIKDQVETTEPSHVKLGLFDIGMDGSDFDVGIES